MQTPRKQAGHHIGSHVELLNLLAFKMTFVI